MTLTLGDKAVVSNLRRDYGEAIARYSDECIAKAWRWYSQSEDYADRHSKPELFVEWVEMVHAQA